MTAAIAIVRDVAAAEPVAPAVALRRAELADCERVWEWNFAPDVRARSKDRRSVGYADHQRWYMRKLADRGCRMWIVEDGGRAVGVVRLDQLSDGAARISIALAAHARGRSIGRRAIAAACAAWGGPVVAEIRFDNAPSRRCFEACAFEPTGEVNGLVTYRWSPGRP